MSAEVEMSSTPPTEKVHKKHKGHKEHKDRSDKKSEKKRKRDEKQDAERSPSKRGRSEAPVATETPATDAKTSSNYDDAPEGSPFSVHTASLYLPLAPISQLKPIDGLCAEHLSPLILTYYAPFRGVVLSYSNVRLSEQPSAAGKQGSGPVLAQSVDEYAVSFVWVTADFLLFNPKRGDWIEGWVNLQHEGHLGLVCWNLFNASIERKRLPKSWQWVGPSTSRSNSRADDQADAAAEGEGYYVDEDGNKVEGKIKFRVKDIETSASSSHERGFLSIEGTMLPEEEEKQLLEQEVSNKKRPALKGRRGIQRIQPVFKQSKPQTVHIETGKASNDADSGTGKHRMAY
ncbi:hypothetical protein L228DRAFT_245222 [Xylona heveae TC161]|uniref:DNA-directed RNA polymerase subunit n=1 Tax=Xylona heveae (strain CBS 132557 / TC161) TaxID=1328760 RepID=A0A165I386_XYLHT|nr:hypothetical protein L228DRAFT_245222 [Xylona heveae TC161]KZF24312.1 hypothetical protein L228DRAFT_245222 [Xylona heveae TC161]